MSCREADPPGGRIFLFPARSSRVEDAYPPGGRPHLHLVADPDVTNSRRAVRFDEVEVGRVMRRLHPSADPERTLSHLAELLVPGICDRAAVTVTGIPGPGQARSTDRPDRPAEPVGVEQIRSGSTLSFAVSAGDGGPADHRGPQPSWTGPGAWLAVLTCTWSDGHRPGRAERALIGLLCRAAAAATVHAGSARRAGTPAGRRIVEFAVDVLRIGSLPAVPPDPSAMSARPDDDDGRRLS